MAWIPIMERSLQLMKLEPEDVPYAKIVSMEHIIQKIVFLIKKRENNL